MVTLLKRGKKKAEAEADAQPMPQAMADAQAASEEARTETATGNGAETGAATSDMGAAQTPVARRPTYQEAATYTPPEGADDFQLPGRHVPAEPPPSAEPSTGKGGLLNRVLLFTGEQTPEERDRIAAQEFEQAIAPVMDYMRAAVPEASTPEEAARILSENQGEITPDPKGGSYVPGDAFDEDARVYYRLLRRDYEKYPRPSEAEKAKQKQSHHLHQVYGKLGGNKGW